MKANYCWAWLLASCFLQSNVFCKQIEQTIADVTYQPTWESLDTRPNPGWYDDAKFGIFLHWGVYAVPSYGGSSEWFWAYWKSNDSQYVKFMNQSYAPGFAYQEFAPEFKAEFFDADNWASVFDQAGAKYVVLTSKHHEGYTLWPSKHSFSWNSVDVGPHRDLVGELSTAIRKRKNPMRFGVYYSLLEWYNPMYLRDKRNNFNTREYVDQKMIPDLVELFENYKPELLWADGDWEATDDYFRSKDIIAWLYNNSTVKDSILVNDRWGKGIPCHHGGFLTCHDRWNPSVLEKPKWEGCHSVDKESWGYRRNAKLEDFHTVKELIDLLVIIVSCGGNLLLNVGPTKDGTIAPIHQDRLHGVGQWLKHNGKAIYETQPWIHQNDTANGNVWYTASKEHYILIDVSNSEEVEEVVTTVYANVLEWPKNNLLYVEDLTNHLNFNQSKIFMLGYSKTLPLKWTQSGKGIWISFPGMEVAKSKWAWCLRITNVAQRLLPNQIEP